MSLNIHYNVGGYDLLTYVVNKEVFEIKDKGWVDVPTGPGIGVEIDEDMVRKVGSEKPAAWREWRTARVVVNKTENQEELFYILNSLLNINRKIAKDCPIVQFDRY